MIARILKAALIAWVGKKLIGGGRSAIEPEAEPTPARRRTTRATPKKPAAARRRAA